jgi:hypothetical protein
MVTGVPGEHPVRVIRLNPASLALAPIEHEVEEINGKCRNLRVRDSEVGIKDTELEV